jgi:hypothetical protein
MKLWSQKLAIVILVFSAALMWAGCTDNNDVIVSSYENNQLSGVESYYPLTQGYQTVYAVHDIGGFNRTVTNRITGTDTSMGYTLVRQTSHSGQTVDTGFFYIGSGAILYFDYPAGAPEKFLQTPLSNGSAWNRFQSSQDDFTDILADLDKGNGSNAKTVPTEGSSVMVVKGTEFVTLSGGDSYSYAVKVENTGSNGAKNAYWFVPGIGLVKYIHGVAPNNPTTGNVVGELVSYMQY